MGHTILPWRINEYMEMKLSFVMIFTLKDQNGSSLYLGRTREEKPHLPACSGNYIT